MNVVHSGWIGGIVCLMTAQIVCAALPQDAQVVQAEAMTLSSGWSVLSMTPRRGMRAVLWTDAGRQGTASRGRPLRR